MPTTENLSRCQIAPRVGPMKISREDVLRVAQLAHLELAPEEVETYRGQLDEILSYVGKLQELDVSGVEPMTQMRPRNADGPDGAAAARIEPELRDDVVVPATWPKPYSPRLPTPPSRSSASPR